MESLTCCLFVCLFDKTLLLLNAYAAELFVSIFHSFEDEITKTISSFK